MEISIIMNLLLFFTIDPDIIYQWLGNYLFTVYVANMK